MLYFVEYEKNEIAVENRRYESVVFAFQIQRTIRLLEPSFIQMHSSIWKSAYWRATEEKTTKQTEKSGRKKNVYLSIFNINSTPLSQIMTQL